GLYAGLVFSQEPLSQGVGHQENAVPRLQIAFQSRGPSGGLAGPPAPRTQERRSIAKFAGMCQRKGPQQALFAHLEETAIADGRGTPMAPLEGDAQKRGISALRELGFRVPRQFARLDLDAPAFARRRQPAGAPPYPLPHIALDQELRPSGRKSTLRSAVGNGETT